MPIHDWTRAEPYLFHNFQFGWNVEISRTLNGKLLPQPLYAMNETIDLRPKLNFVELPEPDGPMGRRVRWEEQLLDSTEHPSGTSYRTSDDRRQYACEMITIRGEFHQPLAAIFGITRQDKETPYRLDALLHLATGALSRGIHVLVIDLIAASQRTKRFHQLLWNRIMDEELLLPSDKPLTLASYEAGDSLNAYIEPLAVADSLPDAPLFLKPGYYVNIPLEATYTASWDILPQRIRKLVESPE